MVDAVTSNMWFESLFTLVLVLPAAGIVPLDLCSSAVAHVSLTVLPAAGIVPSGLWSTRLRVICGLGRCSL